MRRAVLALLAWLCLGLQPVPQLAGPVVDEAGVLSEDDERRIAALAWELKQKAGVEMAVLTVRTTQPEDLFSYGMRVAEAWGLGSAESDDALLLVVAVDDHLLQWFTGYGLEGILPDGRLGRLADAHLVPAFRRGEFGVGIHDALLAAAEIIAADRKVALTGEPLRPRAPELRVPLWPVALALLLLLPLLWLLFLEPEGSRRRRRRYHPTFWGGGFGGSGGGWGGGGGFGGGFGGGGGGFGGGGGGFGGGGVGRSW